MNSNMSSNNSDAIVCNIPAWLPSAIYGIVYTNYYVLPPMGFIIAVLPSLFTAIAFCRQYREEFAYIYQRVYIVHVFYHSSVIMAFFFSRRFSGWGIIGVERWFITNYFVMWYAAHLASQLSNSAALVGMLVLNSMAFDRLLAVGFPVVYLTLNRKRMASILITFSYVVGLGASVFDLPRLQLQQNGDEYKLVTDTNYTSLLAVQGLSNVRNGLNMVAAVLLASLNVATVTLFLKQQNKQKLLIGRKQRSDNRDQDNRKRLERNLLILTVSQSVTLLVEQPMIVANFVITYASPAIVTCYYPIIGPVSEIISQVTHMPITVELYIVSRPFTDLLRKICLRGRSKVDYQRGAPNSSGTNTQSSGSTSVVPIRTNCQRIRKFLRI